MCVLSHFSGVWLFATPWTVAHQTPPSMGFSKQEYWSRLPFPSPEDLPDTGIKPRSPTLQADALTSEPPGTSHNAMWYCADWMTWHWPQIRIFVLAFTSSQHHTVYLSIFPKELGTLSVLLTALSPRLTHTKVLNQFWLNDHIKDVETDAQKG